MSSTSNDTRPVSSISESHPAPQSLVQVNSRPSSSSAVDDSELNSIDDYITYITDLESIIANLHEYIHLVDSGTSQQPSLTPASAAIASTCQRATEKLKRCSVPLDAEIFLKNHQKQNVFIMHHLPMVNNVEELELFRNWNRSMPGVCTIQLSFLLEYVLIVQL